MRHLTLPSTSLKKIFSGSQMKSHHAYDNGLSFFFFFFLGKTHFEVPVFLLFFIFRSFIFILRHCIFVLLFSYRFRPSVKAR